jgi:integrase
MSKNTGIEIRHGRGCKSRSGGSCNCAPSVRAWAYDRRARSKVRRTFTGRGALSEAKSWRADAIGATRRGQLRAAAPTTLRQAWDVWLAGAQDGTIRTRSGDPYKPSVIRSYRQAMELRILDDLGAAKLADIRRTDLQDLADRLLAKGLDPSTVRNALMPIRAVVRNALRRGEIAINPTTGLELPALRGRRDRIASPAEAASLIEALPESERALWATALYAGLRRGELMALRWQDIDLGAGVIVVEHSYDPTSGTTVEPKSRCGRRRVPLAAVLRGHLAAHKLACGWSDGLVFGRTATRPRSDGSIRNRAAKAWADANAAETEKAEQEGRKPNLLVPIGLHEARHTFASLMIAAGVNAKALSAYMGHSSITITLDRYGHLMPGNEEEAAGRLDAYLERAAETRGPVAGQ